MKTLKERIEEEKGKDNFSVSGLKLIYAGMLQTFYPSDILTFVDKCLPSLLPSCVAWTSLIVTLLSVYRHVLPSCLGQFAFNAGCLCRLILGPLLCCLYVVFVSTNKQAHMSKHLCTSLLKRTVHPVCFLPLLL